MKATEVPQAVAELGEASPSKILQWALDTFHHEVTLASSFGLEDVMLIDLLSRQVDSPDVFYLDTDLLFHETYQTIEAVKSRYRLSLRRISPALSLQQQTDRYGEALWSRDPNLCCNLRKVVPLREALKGYRAWITGIRREQSPTRANAHVVEWDEKHGIIKINPLVMLKESAVRDYLTLHQVPYNPLHDQGMPSIGCMPCTRAILPGEDPRSGRWSGFDKKECGLH